MPENRTSATDDGPTVCVAVVTYNHGQFIGDCLRSLIEQEFSGRLKVVVGDDASTDGAQAVIREYAEQFPDIVEPLLNERNVGGRANFLNILRHCSGDFIAVVDGDDTALPGKIARQLHAMEGRPDIAICAHKLRVVDAETGATLRMAGRGTAAQSAGFSELVRRGIFFPNSSVMYRGEYFDYEAIEELHDMEVIGDWLIHMTVARHGAIVVLDEVLGEYRKHGGNVTERAELEEQILRDHLKTLEAAKRMGASDEEVSEGLSRVFYGRALRFLRRGQADEFKEAIVESRNAFKLRGTGQAWFHSFRRYPSILRAMLSAKRKRRQRD